MITRPAAESGSGKWGAGLAGPQHSVGGGVAWAGGLAWLHRTWPPHGPASARRRDHVLHPASRRASAEENPNADFHSLETSVLRGDAAPRHPQTAPSPASARGTGL